MRQSSADVMETLAKPMQLDLEGAMEFCAADGASRSPRRSSGA